LRGSVFPIGGRRPFRGIGTTPAAGTARSSLIGPSWSILAAHAGSTAAFRPARSAELAHPAGPALSLTPWRRWQKLFRGELSVPVLIQLLQGLGSLGNFLSVNHSVLVEVKRRNNGQDGAGLTAHLRSAFRSSGVTPLALHAGAAGPSPVGAEAGTIGASRATLRTTFRRGRALARWGRPTLILSR